MDRRLTAILAADVVGYSRLIRADEEGTIAALKSLRAEIVDPKIAEHRGRIVKLMGDGMLVEFPSVVDAVRTAVETQQALAKHNADLPEDKRIEIRVGVNLGDVVIDGDDIQGDGVNIAARLEGLAETGGICISGSVYEQVRDRLDIPFEDMGEQAVKNIDRPVRVWRWRLDGVSPKAPLELPDKPSIAVLPFDNMSGDPEQEYFSDGITEDIITELSKFRWFFVTARNSSFTYKGAAVDIKRVGSELGVRFVLEGSVRKVGKRVRISAQLIEAASGNHIWAERYDRQLEDIFDLQDEITRTIAAAVEPELAGFERETAMRKPTENLDAWDLYQRGVAKLCLVVDRGSVEEGRALMKQAIALDPDFGRAHGYLAFGAFSMVILGWSEDREASLLQGIADARKAILIDNRDYFAYCALGRLHTLAGDHTAAIRALETSLDINPNFAHGYYGLASARFFTGDAEKTIESADMAIRLSPNDPLMCYFLAYKGLAYFYLGDLDQAIELVERSCQIPTANFMVFTWLAALYAHAGRTQDASKALAEARRLEPELSIANVNNFLCHAQGEGIEQLYDAVREAGLSE